MIEKEAPDGVVIVMRPMELVEVALGCLDLGVHIMIEKPPGCTSRESQQILDRAAQKDRKVMVSMNRRFMPLVRALKAMAVDRGLVYCSATYNKDGFFKGKWTWPSSLPVADSVHLVDLMRFVGGEVRRVYAASGKRDAEFTNTHCAMVVYESGAPGVINTHHCVGARVHRFEVHAKNMSAYMDIGDTHHPSCELWLDGKKAEPPAAEERVPQGVGIENYYETRHFARCIAGIEAAEADLSDVIKSVRLAEALVAGFCGEMRTFVL
jgi:virulence factor